MKQYKIILIFLSFFIGACAPVVYDRRDSTIALTADTTNKVIKPFSRWSLTFEYGRKKQNFLLKMPGEFFVNRINAEKNTQVAIGEFYAQSGLKARSFEDEGDEVLQILIFENPEIVMKPVVTLGKFLHFNWDIDNEKIFECYFYYQLDKPQQSYSGVSHFGIYESRYSKNLQKDGCTLQPTV